MACVAKACRTRSETRVPGQDSLHGREECRSTRCGNAWKQRPRMRISVARVPETCGNKSETRRCWRRFIVLSTRNPARPVRKQLETWGPARGTRGGNIWKQVGNKGPSCRFPVLATQYWVGPLCTDSGNKWKQVWKQAPVCRSTTLAE